MTCCIRSVVFDHDFPRVSEEACVCVRACVRACVCVQVRTCMCVVVLTVTQTIILDSLC